MLLNVYEMFTSNMSDKTYTVIYKVRIHTLIHTETVVYKTELNTYWDEDTFTQAHIQIYIHIYRQFIRNHTCIFVRGQ